jgi:1-acyl-sn-glycerol-3-phosphate acyltransferase
LLKKIFILMGRENIEKYSAGYALLKSSAGFWHNNVFYRKVIIVGSENINPDDYLIFAPNHQNALMDALAVLFTQDGQLIFLARADIFKRKFLASILYFLKILPVYRIRDGIEMVRGNDAIFDKTIDVIKHKNGIVILPEGNHEGIRRLRQLKKGICRIAFQAEEATNFSLNIKIIPVGLEFSHYSRVRQVLTVVYGKPIEVSRFYDSYKENPQRALNELRELLSSEMEKNMVHIESDDDYEALDELRKLINGKYSDDVRMPKLFRDRIVINKMNRLKTSDESLYRRICGLALSIKNKSKELKLNYRVLEKKKHPLGWLLIGILGLVAGFPVFAFGFIFNFVFLKVPDIQTRKIKDIQFHSSMKYAISFILALVLMPVYLVVLLLAVTPWWLGLVFFTCIPVAGLFAWNYFLLYRRIAGGFRIRRLLAKNDEQCLGLLKNHQELISLVEKI